MKHHYVRSLRNAPQDCRQKSRRRIARVGWVKDRLFSKYARQNIWRSPSEKRASGVCKKDIEQVARNRGGYNVAYKGQDRSKKLVAAIFRRCLLHVVLGVRFLTSSIKGFSTSVNTGSGADGGPRSMTGRVFTRVRMGGGWITCAFVRDEDFRVAHMAISGGC